MRRPFAPFAPLVGAVGAMVVVGVVSVAVGVDGWGPAAANEPAIGEVSRWCERVAGGLLREPVNTLGNLGFVVAGYAMLAVLGVDVVRGRDRANRFVGTTPLAVLYALASFFLGPGSMAMHGTHTEFGAWLDVQSMVMFIVIPWLVNVATLARWSDRTLFGAYGVLTVGHGAGSWFIGSDLGIGLDLFEASIGLWIVSEFVYRWWSPLVRWTSGLVGFGVAAVFGIFPAEMLAAPGEYWWMLAMWLPAVLGRGPAPGRRRYAPWFWVGTVSFVVAFQIWLTGNPDHAWCRPDSLIQAHAIWHLLSALATWAFFLFLRTERPLVATGPPGAEVDIDGEDAPVPASGDRI